MKNNRKSIRTILSLTLFLGVLNVDAASRFGMRRFTSPMASTVMQDVPTFGVSEALRYCSNKTQRYYSEEDFIQFPDLDIPHDVLLRHQRGKSDEFIPPEGRHYPHYRYNMNLYEGARKILGDEQFRRVTQNTRTETYLFPDRNVPKLIKDFTSLPFSASGSLWAYASKEDYVNNNPCWSGSASMISPFSAVTAAHCLVSHDNGTVNIPEIFIFVLHHNGKLYLKKEQCIGFKTTDSWRWKTSNQKKEPVAEEEYGLVYFAPLVDVKHGILRVEKKKKNLLDADIQITGYPVDSIELRARRIWPNNLDEDHFIYILKHFNKFPDFFRKFIYDQLVRLSYFDSDSSNAGCLLYASHGKVLKDEEKMVSYDANTLPGQSGGNGVSKFYYTDDNINESGVVLDFLHTLGSSNQNIGNSGVKVDGFVSSTLLKWHQDAKQEVEEIFKTKNPKGLKTEKEILYEEEKAKKHKQEGIKEGIMQGKIEGRKEGEEQAKLDMAKRMISKGKTNEDILDLIDGLTTHQIDALRNNMPTDKKTRARDGDDLPRSG